MSNISVVTGDTSTIPNGIGGSNSRQTVMAGSSAHLAARAVREKALKVAAHMLEASEQDLEIEGSEIRVRGVPGMSVSLGKIAHAVAGTPGYALPPGTEPGMEATEQLVIDNLTFANGTSVAEVEVDIETGAVHILNYVFAHDSGVIVNPMIVDGQVMGGLAHGIGNALFEWMGYDETGQPLTTNLAEYLLISAPEMPAIKMIHHESPTPLNPLGVKGAGECGTVSTSAAIVGAIEDALTPFGVHLSRSPVTPAEIVAAIDASRRSRPS